MSIPSSNLRTFAHRQCRHWFPVKAKELAACRQSAAGAGESAVLARVGSSSSHVNTSPAARAGRRKDGASTGSKPSLRTTYALSHEANANTGLTTEAGERMTVCEKRRGVLLGAWYGNVRSMSAIFAAGPASKESAGQPNSAYAAAAAGRVRQTTGSHSMGMAWHGLLQAAGSTASRVWQLSKYVVHSHVSVRHLSTRPQPSVVQWHGMRCANDVSA
jgi:hypothetical protein